jgi:cystathionine beta-synthase
VKEKELPVVNNITELIAKTPLVRLNHLSEELGANIYAKVEGFNPGNSAKDRSASYMIGQAEKKGLIQPGSTIIEATSGNMGFSIAMICAIKGYKCILTVKNTASKEKLAMLKALGARVILCPIVDSQNPESYYKRAEKLAVDIPDSYYLNQNYNTDNASAHYTSTGPEIWQQTEGKITHYVCCGGTCGTLVGAGRFMKEQNPEVNIIGVDSYGSVLKKFHDEEIFDKDEIYSKKVEGLGKDIIPANYDRAIIDSFVKVTDKDSALQAREVCRNEGLFIGYSSGSACQAVRQIADTLKPTDTVVLLFSDHGSRYLSKIYNDEWMTEQGYIRERRLAAI